MSIQHNHTVDQVLCTIDFSKFTPYVLQAGISLATRLAASLTVFHAVYQPRDALYDGGDQSLRKQAEQAKIRITERMVDTPLSWKTMVMIGEPVEQLAKVIKKKKIDLGASPMEEIEKAAIALTLRRTGGNKKEAARSLGISVASIFNKIKKYGL